MSDNDIGEGPMVVSKLTIEARQQVKAMVERAAQQTGSRMAAYEMVAQQIGRSPEWLRAFACDYAHAKLDMTVLSISAAYRRIATKRDI